MFLLDALGLGLTLITLALLAAGGYLLALRLLGEEARRDLLALAIASLLAMAGEALAIALALGALGLLRFELALAIQALLVGILALQSRRASPAADGGEEARRVARRLWERLRQHPALSLITVHAVGSEALRGLLRPPLSFDSLMYHLLLTATWLQEHNLRPLNGNYPVNDYGYVPANGSLWSWWWMAPSHSELYVNLSALPLWLLLGLAVGGIARQLGAVRHWPIASFLVLVTPTVVRFVATQYVDIFVGAVLLAACFFAIRWLDTPRTADAVLVGVGCGLACGAKILGVPYVAALAAGVILLVPRAYRRWRVRLPQVGLALLLTLALGSFFYLRNIALGAGPLALDCEARGPKGETQSAQAIAILGTTPAAGKASTPTAPGAATAPRAAPTFHLPPIPAVPRRESVLDLWSTVGRNQLLDSFLGITRPQSVELGLGPQTFVVLLAFLVLPFGVAPLRRRVALLAVSQIAFELLFWFTVPYAANHAIFANIRYLIPAVGLAFAGGVAIAEHRGMSDAWLRGLGVALACQGLLQLHAEMPSGVRIVIGILDFGAVALGMSAGLRRLVRRQAGALATAALVLALLGAPLLARFRVADRGRALATEWTAHQTSIKAFTSGWKWLDQHGGDGTVAVIASPGTYFVYPAMGPYLERKVRYFNINAANHELPNRYPYCNPRVDPSPFAWFDHLVAGNVRWLLVSRYPDFDWPIERDWAQADPTHFELRFSDYANALYEFHPSPLIPWRQPSR